jgi:conjugative transposon TraK protein
MMIKNLENKIKLAGIVSIGSFLVSLIIVGMVLSYAHKSAMIERKKIYILDGATPLTASQSDVELNLEIEAKAHIELFHQLFFTLPPDDKYMHRNIEKAMYLADESALKQYNTLNEQGFYSSILSSSAILTIMTDSIVIDNETQGFTYYGVQRIERPTSILKRQLITSGYFQTSMRSDNNPHGLIITKWRTELNRDLEYTVKKTI